MSKEEIFEATHHDWGFSKNAFVYSSTPPYEPLQINFFPVATELHSWLLRRGQLTHLMKGVVSPEGVFENPFTHDATTLACITAQVVNDSHAFSNNKATTCGLDLLSVEIKRIRFYSELVINSARTCEVVIKQLLHCTQIYRKDYEKVALGGLLFKKCRSCDRDKSRNNHNISLLGSLAHRYPPMCLAFDCVLSDLQKVNQERTKVAAHSGAPDLGISSFTKSMDTHNKNTKLFLYRLVHILEHLGALETLMLEELNAAMKSKDFNLLNAPKYCSETISSYIDKWGFWGDR